MQTCLYAYIYIYSAIPDVYSYNACVWVMFIIYMEGWPGRDTLRDFRLRAFRLRAFRLLRACRLRASTRYGGGAWRDRTWQGHGFFTRLVFLQHRHTALTALCAVNATWRSSLYINKQW